MLFRRLTTLKRLTISRCFAGLNGFAGYGEEVNNYKHYDTLGVRQESSQDEIKKAYRQLAFQNHPDRGGSSDRFRNIQEAYSILSNEEKRKQYDRFGEKTPVESEQTNTENYEEILESLFGSIGVKSTLNIISSEKIETEKVSINRTLPLTLEELYQGTTKVFNLTRNRICTNCLGIGAKDLSSTQLCPECQGSGFLTRPFQNSSFKVEPIKCKICYGEGYTFKTRDKCRKCQGNKVVRVKETQKILVPEKSIPGNQIILEGMTDEVPRMKTGDLVFTLVNKQHSYYQLSNNDVFTTFYLSIKDALKPINFNILYLSGNVLNVRLKENIKSIEKITLKCPKYGFRDRINNQLGDLFINLVINDTIKNLNVQSNDKNTEIVEPEVINYRKIHKI